MRHALVVAALASCAISILCVEFPERFSAHVTTKSDRGNIGCGPAVVNRAVYQDVAKNSALWSHYVDTDGIHYQDVEILMIVPSSTADPSTPEATQLTWFSWNSDTDFENCKYRLEWYYGPRVQSFFGFPTSFLEGKEVVDGIECEKWSNKDKAGPYDNYWAVWYPIDAHPPYSVVIKAQYTIPPSRPYQFPVPGCTQIYTFTNFSTAPIPVERFAPPDNWLTNCTNIDQGIKTINVPGRQDGYICVSPTMKNAFEISLQTKPEHGNAVVRIRQCTPQDRCIDGARCKDCVQLNSTELVFTAGNWSHPQTVAVDYLADGDTQWLFESNYYLNNTFNTQFSTCACAKGNCTNDCHVFCGHG